MSILFHPTKSNEDFFKDAFEPETLEKIFLERFQYSPSKGIDRLNGYQFQDRAKNEFTTVSRKIIAGTFRFSPYLEQLRLKGRGKFPRVIAIPTIRDRIVLNQLKECLAYAFPQCVPKNIANSYIRELAKELPNLDPKKAYVCGCDIKDFYGSIDRSRLIRILAKRITHKESLNLLRRCLITPIVPIGINRSNYTHITQQFGIPQGLAVSNLLASIYLQEVDERMSSLSVTYSRYVDDILIYGDESDVRKAYRS